MFYMPGGYEEQKDCRHTVYPNNPHILILSLCKTNADIPRPIIFIKWAFGCQINIIWRKLQQGIFEISTEEFSQLWT